jgi:large subunit ribosomal protein L29
MKASEVRNLPDDELVAEIGRTRQKIFKMSFHAKGAPTENAGVLKNLRKDIARMLTVLREREIERGRRAK